MVVVALLIGLVSGFYLAGMSKNLSVGGNQAAGDAVKKGNFRDNFADGWRAAKEKLAETNPMMNNVFSLSGQVKEVSGKEISFNSNLVNPLDDEALKVRTAVVTGDTKVTIWKLKTPEQIANDQKDGQAKMASLQQESEDLRSTMMNCDKARMEIIAAPAANEESAECKDARNQFGEVMKKMDEARQQMDMYQKIENASLSDVKPGWSINVTSVVIKKAGETDTPAAMMSQNENIASVQKFNAGSIDLREMMVGPAIANPPLTAPAAPAAVPPAKPMVP